MSVEVTVTYKRWEDIVNKGIKSGIGPAQRELEEVKEEIVKACRKNKSLLKLFSKVAIKTFVTLATEVGAKCMLRILTTESTKQIVAQGAKALGDIHPIATAADVAQTGLERLGYEDIGKTVGFVGNVAAGAFVGTTVGGPLGAIIGAFGGLLVWKVGEESAGFVKRAFGDEQPPNKP